MENSDRIDRYNGLAQIFHWLTVILFILVIVFALVLGDEPESADEYREFSPHLTLGVLIFFITVLRLTWRRLSDTPALPVSLPAWEQTLARLVQYLLYAALIAQPLIGVVMVWTEGGSVILFGSLTLPAAIGANEGLSEITDSLHEFIGWSLVWLAALHAAAALRHHFVAKNDVLRSMLPGHGS